MIGPNLEQILNKSIKFANEKKHEFLTLENVLLSMLEDEQVQKVLAQCGVDLSKLAISLNEFLNDSEHFSILSDEEIEELSASQFANSKLQEIARENGIYYQPEISQALQRVIQRAALHVQSSNKKLIQPINLLVAMFSEKESHAVYFLEKEGLTRMNVVEKIAHGVDKSSNTNRNGQLKDQDPLNKRQEKFEKALKEFTTNLNELASAQKIDPVIGRENEIARMTQILSRRRKNNPLLVGDAGVGKTAIAEGLALAIVQGRVPTSLENAVVYSLDMASLLAGTKFRGDFEERLKIVIEALQDDNSDDGKKRILFIDEIHTIIGAGSTSGGSLDASNLLKPALSRGQLRCIGSTTYDEYRKFFEKDQALSRRFQKIDVLEPSVEETIQILEGLKSKFEEHHGVTYSSEIIKSSVELSQKYINDKKLPDKAIDVIDEVGAYLKLQKNQARKAISLEDVEKTIAAIARIPEKSVSTNEKEKLKNLERDLKLLIFGQNEAIEKVSNAIILSRSGLRNESRPIASFVFAGPTGVGKTELAKQLANTLGINFMRIDMSEYMEKHSVAKLTGAPPGYVGYDQGGILTESINKSPYSVLLLDEIEKAHPDIFNILLQVMDHGTLTDSNGRKTDFKNTILIMTSNAGAKEYEAGAIGLGGVVKGNLNSTKRDSVIKSTFSPEFRNRLDAIINFNKLDELHIHRVVEKFLMELENQLMEKKVELEISADAKKWLVETGYDAKLGARPLARIIDEKIKKSVAHEILFGKLEKGGVVSIDLRKNELTFSFREHKSRSAFLLSEKI